MNYKYQVWCRARSNMDFILSRRRKSNHVIIGKKSCEQSIALNRDIIIYILIYSFIQSIAQSGISSNYNPFRKHKENNVPFFFSYVRTYVALIEIGIDLNRSGHTYHYITQSYQIISYPTILYYTATYFASCPNHFKSPDVYPANN